MIGVGGGQGKGFEGFHLFWPTTLSLCIRSPLAIRSSWLQDPLQANHIDPAVSGPDPVFPVVATGEPAIFEKLEADRIVRSDLGVKLVQI